MLDNEKLHQFLNIINIENLVNIDYNPSWNCVHVLFIERDKLTNTNKLMVSFYKDEKQYYNVDRENNLNIFLSKQNILRVLSNLNHASEFLKSEFKNIKYYDPKKEN